MIYLVTDTHPLVWYMGGTFNKLPARVRKAFDAAIEGEAVIWIPSVVLWEISLLQKVGKIKLERTLDECVKHNFGAKAIHVLPLETEDILRSQMLLFSQDPFDTMIVSAALGKDCPLITADGNIHEKKPCELFWD